MDYQLPAKLKTSKSALSEQCLAWHDKTPLYLLGFCIILLLLRVFLCNPTLGLDEAEQVLYTQHLSPGYPSQPPLYTWLQWGFFELVGVNLMGLALFKYFLLFLIFLVYYKICCFYCTNRYIAWCALFSWALIPPIGYDLLPHRTHALLSLLAALLTWYWILHLPTQKKTRWFLIFGLILTVGLISKFNYLIFLGYLLLILFSIPVYRKELMNRRLLISLSLSLLITSPYWIWLLNNLQIGLYSSYKLALPGVQVSHGIMSLIKQIMCFMIPLLVIPFFFKRSVIKNQNPAFDLLNRYHQWILLFLISLVLTFKINSIKPHWLLPLLFMFPVWFFSQVRESINFKKMRIYVLICMTLQSLFLLLWVVRTPHLAEFPLNSLVNKINQEHKEVDAVVSNSVWLLGSLIVSCSTPGIFIHPLRMELLPRGKLILAWEGANNLAGFHGSYADERQLIQFKNKKSVLNFYYLEKKDS